MSLNTEISDLFLTMSALMEIRGENLFKVLAFQKVGRLLRDIPVDLRKCVEQNTLCDIEGVGKSSQKIIEEYIQAGKSSDYEQIVKGIPPGLVPMLQIDGLGPKTISVLWKQCRITSLDELKKAIDSGSLCTVRGMGEKKIANIKAGIAAYEARTATGAAAADRRTGIMEALVPAEQLLEHVRNVSGITRAQIAGSLRRRRETIADIDIVCAVPHAAAKRSAAPDLGAIAHAFTKLPGVIQTIASGPTKTSVAIAEGLRVDLRVVPEENYGAALMYFTGSKDHNVKVRTLAQKKKLTLNEWGLYRLSDYEKVKKEVAHAPPIKPVASKTEADIYAKLGMDYVEPEMREDRGEVDAALEHRLPVLIVREDIKGDLHTHTTASDGNATIEEIAAAARALGYEYLAITDHSKSQVIANGLPVERLLKHIQQIRKANDKLKGITLLAGSEVDIMADGRLDYEDAVLKELDIVVASPHFSLKQEENKATDRLKRAIDSRYVNIIGHPTGRLINRRAGLPIRFDSLLELACKNGTAFEINASYPRLDLDEHHARAAAAAGCLLCIDTDAHSTVELDLIPYGLGVARRAWITKDKVINCLPFKQLKQFLARKR